MNREEILRRPAYWFEETQNEIYSQVVDYMEREGINQTQLAQKLNVGKSYVSQILKGNYNFSLKKWIELCLAIGIVPGEYRKIEDVIKADYDFMISKKKISSETTNPFAEYDVTDNIVYMPVKDFAEFHVKNEGVTHEFEGKVLSLMEA